MCVHYITTKVRCHVHHCVSVSTPLPNSVTMFVFQTISMESPVVKCCNSMIRLESVSDCVRGIAAAGVQCTSNPRIVSRSKLHHTYLTMYVLLKIRNVKLDLCSMRCKLFVYIRIPTVVVAVRVVGRGGDELFWSTHQTPLPHPSTL